MLRVVASQNWQLQHRHQHCSQHPLQLRPDVDPSPTRTYAGALAAAGRSDAHSQSAQGRFPPDTNVRAINRGRVGRPKEARPPPISPKKTPATPASTVALQRTVERMSTEPSGTAGNVAKVNAGGQCAASPAFAGHGNTRGTVVHTFLDTYAVRRHGTKAVMDGNTQLVSAPTPPRRRAHSPHKATPGHNPQQPAVRSPPFQHTSAASAGTAAGRGAAAVGYSRGAIDMHGRATHSRGTPSLRSHRPMAKTSESSPKRRVPPDASTVPQASPPPPLYSPAPAWMGNSMLRPRRLHVGSVATTPSSPAAHQVFTRRRVRAVSPVRPPVLLPAYGSGSSSRHPRVARYPTTHTVRSPPAARSPIRAAVFPGVTPAAGIPRRERSTSGLAATAGTSQHGEEYKGADFVPVSVTSPPAHGVEAAPAFEAHTEEDTARDRVVSLEELAQAPVVVDCADHSDETGGQDLLEPRKQPPHPSQPPSLHRAGNTAIGTRVQPRWLAGAVSPPLLTRDVLCVLRSRCA